jgi:hypothetical protein
LFGKLFQAVSMRHVTIPSALAFVARHGIVLETARGSVPTLAHLVIGPDHTGSWWSHPKATILFRLTVSLRASQQLLVCRLVAGRITYVHRRLWTALYRLRHMIGTDRVSAVQELHGPSGAHKTITTSMGKRIGLRARAAASRLTPTDAQRTLAPYATVLWPVKNRVRRVRKTR